jgi:hypothetical protein
VADRGPFRARDAGAKVSEANGVEIEATSRPEMVPAALGVVSIRQR